MAKILLLTSKTGGGHISLAEALRDKLQTRHHVEIIDPQPTLVHWHYRMVSRHALWLWAAEFKSFDTPRRARLAHKIYYQVFGRYVRDVLSRVQPDFIISTYAMLTYAVAEAMVDLQQQAPFALLLVDTLVHNAFLTEKRVEAIFTTTRENHDQTLAAGFAPAGLHFTGWPVRDQFYRTLDSGERTALLRQLKLDPERFTVFLQGGGEGAAKFGETVENVLKAHSQPQIILAAGTNQALFDRFSGLPAISPLPFTKNIAPFMAAADVVMGKAGPNMLFETITLGKPFIATTYIPGQEEVNLKFIQRHQLGWVALTAGEQGHLIEKLMNDPMPLKAMTEKVNAYRAWNTQATDSILPVTEKILSAER